MVLMPPLCPLTVALLAIGTQLVACMAHTLKGPASVEAAVGTVGQPRGTFIHVWMRDIKEEGRGRWPETGPPGVVP